MRYPDMDQEMILALAYRMKEGECIRFSMAIFDNAFPCHPLFEDRPPMDQFLEKMIGANYGAWTCEPNMFDGYYLISRHVPKDHLVRRDWDRRHIPLANPHIDERAG